VPVNLSNVDYTAGLASGAIHVHPRHVSDDGGPDGRRPHVTAGGKILAVMVAAIDARDDLDGVAELRVNRRTTALSLRTIIR
jgi:hypothetical protein